MMSSENIWAKEVAEGGFTMGSGSLIWVLLSILTVVKAQGGTCGPALHTTRNNWQEKPGTAKRQFHVRGGNLILDHAQSFALKFTTRVFNCQDEGVLITTESSGNFMANTPRGSSNLGVIGNPGSGLKSNHHALFKYSSSGSEGLGTLRSIPGSGPYVSEGSNGILKLSGDDTKWESLPAVTVCGSDTHTERSPMTSTIAFDEEPDAPDIPISVDVSMGRLDVKEIYKGDKLFQFYVEKYDLLERYDEHDELVICDAVILSSSAKIFVEPEDDDVKEEEEGYLPHIPYSRVNLEFTDDEVMAPYFTYLRPDTVNQTSIGNRHFRVFEQRPGVHRLQSTMRPDRYLSIIRVENEIVLGLSPLNESLPRFEISYDFSFDIPDLQRHRCKPQQF